MQEDLPSLPIIGYGKGAFVRSHRIPIMGYVRWIRRKGIFHIRVDRRAVSFEFPVGRDRNVVPCTDIIFIFIKIDGPVGGLSCPVELPIPIEGLNIGRTQRIVRQGGFRICKGRTRTMGRFPVPAHDIGIFPVIYWNILSNVHTRTKKNEKENRNNSPFS